MNKNSWILFLLAFLLTACGGINRGEGDYDAEEYYLKATYNLADIGLNTVLTACYSNLKQEGFSDITILRWDDTSSDYREEDGYVVRWYYKDSKENQYRQMNTYENSTSMVIPVNIEKIGRVYVFPFKNEPKYFMDCGDGECRPVVLLPKDLQPVRIKFCSDNIAQENHQNADGSYDTQFLPKNPPYPAEGICRYEEIGSSGTVINKLRWMDTNIDPNNESGYIVEWSKDRWVHHIVTETQITLPEDIEYMKVFVLPFYLTTDGDYVVASTSSMGGLQPCE